MTTDAVMRAWAKDRGIEVPTRGQVPKGVREQYEAANPETDNPELSPDEAGGEHGYVEPELTPTRPQGHPDEVAPTRAPTTRWSLRRPKAAAVVKGGRSGLKRASLESIAETAWGALGNIVAAQGLIPTGRALKLQAPIAGMILEDSLKGTIADRVLQPFARSGDAMREVSALLGVPILVTVLSVKPETAEQVLPHLKKAMRDWAIIAGPKMKAREKREEKALEQLGVDAAGLDQLVDEWIAGLFAPPPGQEEAPDGA